MTNDKLIQEEERVFANMQRQGWSTRWGNDDPQDEEHTAAMPDGWTVECSDQDGNVHRYVESHCSCKSGVKPLLVIQLRDTFTPRQGKLLHDTSLQIEDYTGYKCLIVDSMDEAKVQLFGVDAPGLETLTLDQLIGILEALKRMREAAGGV